MKTVGERIRQAREALKMSGEALAIKAGYQNQSAIGNLENRAGGTGGRRLSEIAKVLNVSCDWLLKGPDSPTVPFLQAPDEHAYPPPLPATVLPADTTDIAEYDPAVKEVIALMRGMSAAGKQEVIRYIRYMSTQHGHASSQSRESPPTRGSHSFPHPKAA